MKTLRDMTESGMFKNMLRFEGVLTAPMSSLEQKKKLVIALNHSIMAVLLAQLSVEERASEGHFLCKLVY